jgi:hypothetical protein
MDELQHYALRISLNTMQTECDRLFCHKVLLIAMVYGNIFFRNMVICQSCHRLHIPRELP